MDENDVLSNWDSDEVVLDDSETVQAVTSAEVSITNWDDDYLTDRLNAMQSLQAAQLVGFALIAGILLAMFVMRFFNDR